MGYWSMQHPWMTLIIALVAIEAFESIIKYLTGWHKTDKEIELAILKERKSNGD